MAIYTTADIQKIVSCIFFETQRIKNHTLDSYDLLDSF